MRLAAFVSLTSAPPTEFRVERKLEAHFSPWIRDSGRRRQAETFGREAGRRRRRQRRRRRRIDADRRRKRGRRFLRRLVRSTQRRSHRQSRRKYMRMNCNDLRTFECFFNPESVERKIIYELCELIG